jgi:hypothetical protein
MHNFIVTKRANTLTMSTAAVPTGLFDVMTGLNALATDAAHSKQP